MFLPFAVWVRGFQTFAMHGRNGCAPHGCGLYPVSVASLSLSLTRSLLFLYACKLHIDVSLQMYGVLQILALGPVTRIAKVVYLILFHYGPLENGGRVCIHERVSLCVLMSVCRESLIKYFACRNLERSLSGASNSAVSPSPVS